MKDESKAVALFADHTQAEAAVRDLQRAGFDMKKLSIVGRDYSTEEQVLGYVSSGDRVRYWGKYGALWGGLWGLLVGSAMLVFPGIGPVVALGPLSAALLNLAGGAIVGGGVGAFGGALASIGIPPEAVLKYETAIKAGHFAVVAHGTADDVRAAQQLLSDAGAQEVHAHAPVTTPVTAPA
jgi:hypothetical protein